MIVLPHEPLARHTALRTGGPCGALVYVDDDGELATVVRDTRRAEWKLRVLGAGTRVVARDGGLPDTVVVRLAGSFERIEVREDGAWDVGAGVLVPVLRAEAARRGLAGLQALAGVAGTVGASVLSDPEWDPIVDVVYVLSRDVRREVPRAELKEHAVVLGARLHPGPAGPDVPGPGGPPGARYRLAPGPRPKRGARPESVRAVLTSVTLPLVRLREIAVPASAPELLCNLGAGTAADVALLHRSAVERVEKVRGLELESTIDWWGVDPPPPNPRTQRGDP